MCGDFVQLLSCPGAPFVLTPLFFLNVLLVELQTNNSLELPNNDFSCEELDIGDGVQFIRYSNKTSLDSIATFRCATGYSAVGDSLFECSLPEVNATQGNWTGNGTCVGESARSFPYELKAIYSRKLITCPYVSHWSLLYRSTTLLLVNECRRQLKYTPVGPPAYCVCSMNVIIVLPMS